MYEYFANNGFNLEDEIFNVEFEMHRTHLRQYNITTVEELLTNAENLFRDSMNQIRLVDINSISDDAIKHNNKRRANTLPIWQHIHDSYKLDSFLQTSLPLQRVKRIISVYDDTKFKIEYVTLLRKAFINNLHIDMDFIETLFYKAKESLKKSTTNSQLKKDKSFILLEDQILFSKPTKHSKPLFKISKGRLLIVKKCKKNWCRVKTENFLGWVKTNKIWGLY